MRNCWKQFVGDAPPQSTVGPSVTHENMGPDALRQLSPSDDREASRAQHKTGSKRAGSNTRCHSGSREKSSSDHNRARVRRPLTSPDSSSPRRDACHLLPNAHDGTDVRFPMTAAHQTVGSVPHALGNLAPQVHVVLTHPILLHLTAGTGVARLPLVGPPGPA